MSEPVFDESHHAAVAEPVSAGADTPPGLTPAESRLYHRLLTETRGRLEQEFLPADRVQEQIRGWLQS